MCSGCVVFHCLPLLLSTNKEILKAHSQSLNLYFLSTLKTSEDSKFSSLQYPTKKSTDYNIRSSLEVASETRIAHAHTLLVVRLS
jgi:hypothetical protein